MYSDCIELILNVLDFSEEKYVKSNLDFYISFKSINK